jgi:hypothetical protein
LKPRSASARKKIILEEVTLKTQLEIWIKIKLEVWIKIYRSTELSFQRNQGSEWQNHYAVSSLPDICVATVEAERGLVSC